MLVIPCFHCYIERLPQPHGPALVEDKDSIPERLLHRHKTMTMTSFKFTHTKSHEARRVASS